MGVLFYPIRLTGSWGYLIAWRRVISNVFLLKYTPYGGPILSNQINRKLGIFDRKLKVRHSLLCSGLYRYMYGGKGKDNNVKTKSFFSSIEANTFVVGIIIIVYLEHYR